MRNQKDSQLHQSDWEARYRAGETGWDRQQVSPALYAWLATGALQPGRVLVPGCGQGHEVVALARAGYEVVAVDFAEPAVRALKETLDEAGVTAQVLQEDLLRWRPERVFDLIYEQTCLCALDPPDWPAYAERLHQWLRPGGRLMALFMQTDQPGGPPYHCALDDMRSLFPVSRWRWPGEEAVAVEHRGGKRELPRVLVRI